MLALSVVALWAIVASGQSRPFFGNGQRADLLLSGYGFNRTGGALRFNHPGGVAVVSGSLVLADRNNNRVLVWQGPALIRDRAADVRAGPAVVRHQRSRHGA